MNSKILSRKRMYILLKHYEEISREIQMVYPKADELCEKYQMLDRAFSEAIDLEAKFQSDS